jgi:deoxyribodipyrimidine photolyase-related protein
MIGIAARFDLHDSDHAGTRHAARRSAGTMAPSTTVWISGDQCTPHHTALAAADRASTVVLMIESIERARLQRYHKRKLVLIYAAMRHFAEDLRRAGWTVDYHVEAPDFATAFAAHVAAFAPARVVLMEQSEWGATEAMRAIAARHGCDVTVTAHANFLSTAADYDRLLKRDDARVTMETFYRAMRRSTGLLMDGDAPAGGAWNFDAENRRPPARGLRFPAVPRYPPDAITREAIALVERRFAENPGTIGDFALAVRRTDALHALDAFVADRLPTFGPWQDAMLAGEREMSHAHLAYAINVGLLHPLEVARRAERAYRDGAVPLASAEGFIRQVIGWREYVWRIYWKRMPAYRERNALGAIVPLPAFFTTGKTSMFCLADVLAAVRETGYAHHIQRLMILGNFALIAGLEPVAVNDWFWGMFVDAYDWVMVPNVIGMALHADGGEVGTKPYAASANYINRMSDYCGHCRYDPKQTTGPDACPFNALYWDFIDRNAPRFARNPRMAVIVRSWQGRELAAQETVRRHAAELVARIASGESV